MLYKQNMIACISAIIPNLCFTCRFPVLPLPYYVLYTFIHLVRPHQIHISFDLISPSIDLPCMDISATEPHIHKYLLDGFTVQMPSTF